jgi:hypothetical protein
MHSQHDADALVERFLNLKIAASDFTHDLHVAVGWALLRRMHYVEALACCTATIKAMAEREGAPQKFNTTITVAYLALIDGHLRETPDATWPEFIAAHPKLMDKTLLARWYPAETLRSPEARATFVMPPPSA